MITRCLQLASSHLPVTRALTPAGMQERGDASFGPYGKGRNDAFLEPLAT